MRIPKRFKLLGKTIKVEYDHQLDYKDGATGMAYYRSQRIAIQPSTESAPITDEDMQQVFLHELLHHCLHCMEHKLRSDESFVNLLSGLLHQAFTTAEYD